MPERFPRRAPLEPAVPAFDAVIISSSTRLLPDNGLVARTNNSRRPVSRRALLRFHTEADYFTLVWIDLGLTAVLLVAFKSLTSWLLCHFCLKLNRDALSFNWAIKMGQALSGVTALASLLS